VLSAAASILLSLRGIMKLLWWIPVAAAVVGAGAWFRARRRRRDIAIVSGTPVSEQWLAQARGREEHHW
jgi:cytochrome c-type biogenesis protein CcmH/NrfF